MAALYAALPIRRVLIALHLLAGLMVPMVGPRTLGTTY